MTVFSVIIILQKSTNFHAIPSWSFTNRPICNEIGWPVAPFFAPPCIYVQFIVKYFTRTLIANTNVSDC